MDTQLFGNQLLRWYAQHKRALPWRETSDPYKVWLSEVILQQTRVNQGLPYYERFVFAFPTIFELANAPEEAVLKLWQGLGYYSRAKNLHQTAKKIAFELGGKFPTEYAEILKLKGVGEYTASAIVSICYSAPYAVVDGNVYRVLSRVFGIETPINSSAGISLFKNLANELLVKEKAGIYNQALMDFGATQCKPQSPDCNSCVFSEKCEANLQRKVDFFPVKIKKTKVKKRFFNYLLVLDNQGFTILNKRAEKDIWQGLYEFPLIETNTQLLENEVVTKIKERFPTFEEITLFSEKPIIHKLSHQHLFTWFWVVKIPEISGEKVDFQSVTDFPMPILIANFLQLFFC